jgi:hypothetical protein
VVAEESNVHEYMAFLQQIHYQIAAGTPLDAAAAADTDADVGPLPTAAEIVEELQNVREYLAYLQQLHVNLQSGGVRSQEEEFVAAGASDDSGDFDSLQGGVADEPADEEDLPTLEEVTKEEQLGQQRATGQKRAAQRSGRYQAHPDGPTMPLDVRCRAHDAAGPLLTSPHLAGRCSVFVPLTLCGIPSSTCSAVNRYLGLLAQLRKKIEAGQKSTEGPS